MAATPSASSKRAQSTRATSVSSSRTRRSSAYDANFEQHLIDHNIYPPLYDFPNAPQHIEPLNWDYIRNALKAPRLSLSPSAIEKTAFKEFQRKNKTKSEGTVMRSVVPDMAGDAKIPNEGHLPFNNLDSITNETTVNPVPDFFDGVWPGDIDKKVRNDLDRIIVPSKKAGVPVAPNFFLEAKGPGGTIEVAVLQAVLDGAHGAQMMHALQNYLVKEPVYDGNAYAFTSTLLDGYLKLYAHHITAPMGPGLRPDQHTTQLKAYALTGDEEVWLEGLSAFRNLRQLAKDYRDQLIATANARSREQLLAIQGNRKTDAAAFTEACEAASSPLDFYECRMFAESDDESEIVEPESTEMTKVGLAIIDNGRLEYDQEDEATQVPSDFATSLVSSFASTCGDRPMTPTCSKHPKLPHSPPSPASPRRYKKRVSDT